MGYPMSWRRLVHRNRLMGGYDGVAGSWDDVGAPQWTFMDPTRFECQPRNPDRPQHQNIIAGDMRRLEADSRDPRHLAEYAKAAGITPEQAKAVLDLFFERA
jgi:hypothetical protein